MSIDIGICTTPDKDRIAAAAGASFIEVNIQKCLVPMEASADLTPLRNTAVPVLAANCFLPGGMPSVGPEVDRSAIKQYAERAFQRAANVGIRFLVFGSGGSRRLPEGLTAVDAAGPFTELLAELAPIAHELGVTLVLEPLNTGECNFINTIGEGATFVRTVDHPGLRLLADLYHMLRNDEPPEDLEGHIELLAHVHIAEKDERTPPGRSGDDFTPYLRRLAQGGYQGAISMEARFEDLAAEAPDAVQVLREQCGTAGL